MKGGTAVFTIIAKNYLPYARVLMRSLAEHHPSWRRFVILVDRPDGYFDPRREDFEIVLSSDLSIARSRWFHFKYTILELSTAMKPYAFEYLFDTHGFDLIIYLDPDIRVYSPLQEVTKALESANVALIPHLTHSLEDEKRPSEIEILRTGAYNLGFIGVARTPETAMFLAWWRKKLYDHCVVDLPRGLFVDQRWIDLVPGMFEGVAIIRDAGYNVAYWNLSHRIVSRSEAGYAVNGSALAFFHFSGYDADSPDQLSRHQNRFRVQDLPEALRQLLLSYRKELLSAGYRACQKWPYTFATFQNGTPIPDMGRAIHLETPELVNTIDDPFSDEGFQAFLDVWNGPVSDEQNSHPGISRLAYRIYRARTDVQSAMPDIFESNYTRFLEWMFVNGRREHGLGEVFLRGVSNARDVLSSELVDARASSPEGERHRITRLAAAIYDSRPDLQLCFPDPGGRDRARFLTWLLTYGRKGHDLSAHHIAPIKEQWRASVAALPRWSQRLRCEIMLGAMEVSVRARSILKLPEKTRDVAPAAIQRKHAPDMPARSREFGVNLVGYFHSATGMGQAVRASRDALRAAGVPTSLRSVEEMSAGPHPPELAGPMSAEFPYSTNLFHVNADQTTNVWRMFGEDFYWDRRNIGYWLWELEEFPDRWKRAFSQYQEIWTPSSFCQDAIARKASVPVFRIPLAINPAVPVGMDRQYFGLVPDRFVFLYAFDVQSVPERKNPLAVIRAFEKAFGANSNCQLVLKINHARVGSKYVETLKNAGSSAVTIIDSTLTREQMNALIHCADCVVSLHRSEGFGLLLAEAMYLGKPVIATNYSGNTDFTRPDNSLLVDYKLIPVGRNCEPYDPLSLWADPDVEQASSYMLGIVNSSDLRARLSSAGRAFVRANLSPEAVGRTIRDRLSGVQRADRLMMAAGTRISR